MKKNILWLLVSLFFSLEICAQATGDFRTRQSGDWTGTSTWQTFNGTDWVNTTSNPHSTTANVTIRSGDSVRLNTSPRNVANLTLESGARLYSTGGSNSFIQHHGTELLVDGSMGRYSTVGSKTNDSSISVSLRGGPNVIIHGSGTLHLNRLNRDGSSTGDIDLEIDMDIELSWNNTAIWNDVAGIFNVVINAGRTVHLANANTHLSIDGLTGTGGAIGGHYQILGTLLVGGICYCRTDNGGTAPQNRITIKSGGLMRCGEVNTSGNGAGGFFFNVENSAIFQVTGNHGAGTNSNQFFTYQPGSIVEYIGTGAQQIACPDTFSVLRLGGTGNKTLQFANARIADTLEMLGTADAIKGSFNFTYVTSPTLNYTGNATLTYSDDHGMERTATINEYPATAGPSHLVINNRGLKIIQNTVVKMLTFTDKFGFLFLNGNTLTIDSTVKDTARLSGTYSSNLIIQGTGNEVLVRFPNNSNHRRLINFTVNRANGARLVSNLQVLGLVTHTNGTINSNGFLNLVYLNRNSYGQVAGTGSGTITGDMSIQTRIEGGAGWRPLGSAFDNIVGSYNGSMSLFYGSNSSNNVVQFREDWGIPHWRPAANANAPMNVNTAYSFYVQAMTAPYKPSALPAIFTQRGNYRGTGDVTHTNLTRTTGAHTTADTTGWHYRTNPFPCGLLWTPSEYTNVQGNAYYIWRDSANAWGSWNGTTGTNGVNALIPPLAVPLFKVTSATNSVAFKNSHRTTDRNNYFAIAKKAPENEVHLLVKGANGEDELAVYSDADANLGMDAIDVPKMMNPEGSLNFYAVPSADLQAAINLMPLLNGENYALPLVFQTTQSGMYTISAKISNLQSGYSVMLEDVKANKVVNLQSDYPFSYQPAQGKRRFVLHYRYNAEEANTQQNTGLASEIKVNCHGNELKVWMKNLHGGTFQVEIYSISGQMVHSASDTINLQGAYNAKLNVPSGIYLVRVSDGYQTHVERIVITQ